MHVPPITHDDLSSIFGWVSIACWVVVYTPQIYENYVLQSGEGLSVLFVLIWLAGDLFNVLGAIIANLLPTMVILGLYYTVCDVILLGQIYYYRWKRAKLPHLFSQERQEERVPLLPGDRNDDGGDGVKMVLLRYTGALVFVFATGTIAWWLSSSVGYPEEHSLSDRTTLRTWTIQILGWSSAILFLGARIPQILKNLETRCEGLTPTLFFFTSFGNITYVLSICVKSMEKPYLITNASWLAGSALTVFLDCIVLAQILYYRTHPTNR
ncbi:PQ-loop-domain-containing protein [Marasmius fiardii PR-910]|nr:PQ-loop-domain-containing protein [Marasmius fiardii PR-910]